MNNYNAFSKNPVAIKFVDNIIRKMDDFVKDNKIKKDELCQFYSFIVSQIASDGLKYYNKKDFDNFETADNIYRMVNQKLMKKGINLDYPATLEELTK